MITNWFVALNGRIIRHKTLSELQGEWSNEFKTKHADKIPAHSLEYEQRIPHAWEAGSEHVPTIKGWGDTPEEAIRDFETKMRKKQFVTSKLR